MIYGDRGEIHEVKPDKAWDDAELLADMQAIAAYIEDRGWRFSLTTEGELKAEPCYSNIRALWRQAARKVHAQLTIDMTRIAAAGAITIEEIIDRIGFSGDPDSVDRWEVRYAQVLALLARGHLYHDRDVALSRTARIWTSDSGPQPRRLLPFRSPLEMHA